MEITSYPAQNQSGFTIVGKLWSLEDYQKLRNLCTAVLGENKTVVIDLSRLTFSSSHGLSLFVEMDRLMHRNGKKLLLVNPRNEIRTLIELLGIDKIISLLYTNGKNAEDIQQEINEDCPQ
jgi:anti-anti-sigma factor